MCKLEDSGKVVHFQQKALGTTHLDYDATSKAACQAWIWSCWEVPNWWVSWSQRLTLLYKPDSINPINYDSYTIYKPI